MSQQFSRNTFNANDPKRLKIKGSKEKLDKFYSKDNSRHKALSSNPSTAKKRKKKKKEKEEKAHIPTSIAEKEFVLQSSVRVKRFTSGYKVVPHGSFTFRYINFGTGKTKYFSEVTLPRSGDWTDLPFQVFLC
jgi:hypothetical protein